MIPEGYTAQPRPFLFADEASGGKPYADGYEASNAIHLDWGLLDTISHFQYDEGQNAYFRFCGEKMNEDRWAPFQSYAAVDDRSEENTQTLSFSNVIVQRIEYGYLQYDSIDDISYMPDMWLVGKGNADIFIGGRYIPGYWVRNSLSEPTVFYDDQGKELVLNRGKTFIAHFPVEALCTFQ
jgi:hypothetical protein